MPLREPIRHLPQVIVDSVSGLGIDMLRDTQSSRIRRTRYKARLAFLKLVARLDKTFSLGFPSYERVRSNNRLTLTESFLYVSHGLSLCASSIDS